MKQKFVLILLFIVIYITTAQINPKIQFQISPYLYLIENLFFINLRKCTTLEKKQKPCGLTFEYVCGIHFDILGRLRKSTFLNQCFACQNQFVEYVQNGKCSPLYVRRLERKPLNCQNFANNQLACPLNFQPVCGVFYWSNLGEQQQESFLNQCFACKFGFKIKVYDGLCSSI